MTAWPATGRSNLAGIRIHDGISMRRQIRGPYFLQSGTALTSLRDVDHNVATGLGPFWSEEIRRALMETQYNYRASAQFHQHDRSFVLLEQGVPRFLDFSAPPEFGGEPGMWTPEHFLLAAVASCFIETFKAVAKASKLDFQGIEVGVDGSLEKDAGGLRFTKITVQPALIIYADESYELAVRLLEKAERICLVVRSLSSEIRLEPKILVENPVVA